MAGFENGVMVAKNVNFDEAAAKPHLGIINAAGKLPIGTGNSSPTPEILGGAITSPGATITVGYSTPNITLDVNGAHVGETITGNSGGALSPTAGNWNILGASTAAGTSPVTTSGAVSTLTVNVQKSQAIAATDATKVGLANFDSAAFDVDANGFVQLNGGGIASTAFDVQANTAPGTDPVVPTAAGVVVVNGAAVANHSVVLETRSRAVNTYNLEVQYATTAAATDATKSGVSHFDSAAFDVDANGFVQLNGGGIASTAFDVDAHTAPGTDPVVPSATGVVIITGAQVAAGIVGANVIRTDSLAVNSMTIEVQRTAAVGASASINNGVSHFDSAAFDVDANGFVQLNGGGIAATSFDIQANTAPGTDPVVPTAAGLVTVNGAAVANHSVVLETRSRAANAYNLEVQYSAAAAATDATKSGVAHFDSANFTVDANGFVSASTTGFVKTLTGNSGGAIAPVANNINTLGTGSITIAGAGSTLTTQLTGLTNHAVLVGAGTATITNVGPTATAGQVLQSAGAAADPVFSTATYPSTTTINQILYSSANNVVSQITATNRAVLTSGATGVPAMTALAADGQLIIGSTAGAPAAATLTAGTGISITNASNSITVAVNGGVVGETITGDSGGALSPTAGNWNILGRSGSKTSGSGSTLTVNSPPFSQIGASATSVLNTGEFVTAAVTRTLPVSAGLLDGDLFIYVCTTAGALVIQSVGAQKIRIGSLISSAAGTATSTAIGDSVTLRFNATDGFFYSVSSVGVWLLA